MELSVQNLAVARGGRQVLSGVSFRLSKGETLLLTGPNGAGKTTLLRAIAGLLPPSAGTIGLSDSPDPDQSLSEQLHYIGHQNAIKARLTVQENLLFWAALLGGPRPARHRADDIDAALSDLDLAGLAGIEAAYLSAGQRRRLALARLLVAHRTLWLLDEPTVSLDKASVQAFSSVVARHVAAGGMVLAATHIPLGLSAVRELRLVPEAIAA